ncbi:hypothetical protein SRABI128_05067 [Microbacterium sp. Bi128]|nr:hypothetical protein SRABI128_05067 [Microbacterium sp. Bi128]
MTFGEGRRLQRLRQRGETRLQPPGAQSVGGGDGEDVELVTTFEGQGRPGIHDDLHVSARQRAGLPRIESEGEAVGEGHGPTDLRLHAAIRHALRGSDLGRDLPQRHLGRLRRGPHPRRRVEGEMPRTGERAGTTGLGGGNLGVDSSHLGQHRREGSGPVVRGWRRCFEGHVCMLASTSDTRACSTGEWGIGRPAGALWRRGAARCSRQKAPLIRDFSHLEGDG